MIQIAQVMTPANSVIGVSLLTMPFCFKQCGIVLAVLMLILCNIMSRLACHFLLKSAGLSNKRRFVLLASYAFGRRGKFLAQLLIIGFMLSTCVAYFAVIGDVGSQIISKTIDETPEVIRPILLIITGILIILPLGLLQNIHHLFNIYISTVIFYLCFVIKIIIDSIFLQDWWGSVNWWDNINYWRSAGISQCLPIFFMALFCQTQLLEIYETIPTTCVEIINNVVREALNICTFIYICVGLFGYIGFCNSQSLAGNILLSFEPDIVSEVMKLGFVLSVVFNFPLVIFQFRERLNYLLFNRVTTHELFISHLPKSRFEFLTIVIVNISLLISILMPNIEFVLSIVGSTIGVMICLIFPAAIFISITDRNTCQRLLAQCVVIFGICIMVFCMYANLHPMEKSTNAKSTNILFNEISRQLNITKDLFIITPNVSNNLILNPRAKNKIKQKSNITFKKVSTPKYDIPLFPIPEFVIDINKKQNVEKSDKTAVNMPKIKEIKVETIKTLNENLNAMRITVNTESSKIDESITLKAEEKIKIIKEKEGSADPQNDFYFLD